MKKIALSYQQIHTGFLILVNREHAYLEKEAVMLAPVADQPKILLHRQAARLLEALMAKLQGWDAIAPVSGWRSLSGQQRLWEDSLRENGLEYTRAFVALPGHSEHQTGLAIDLGLMQEEIDYICPEFPYSGICQQFRELAPDYGFIQRYPAEKEKVTGIGHEPWHFRYVEAPHAVIMARLKLTLEEYIAFIKQFDQRDNPYRITVEGKEFLISYFPAKTIGYTCLTVDERYPYCISGNNVDGFILTEWRQ